MANTKTQILVNALTMIWDIIDDETKVVTLQANKNIFITHGDNGIITVSVGDQEDQKHIFTISPDMQVKDQITVTAQPAPGYQFIKWIEDGNQISDSASYTFTVNRRQIFTAVLGIAGYDINLEVDPLGSGTVSGGGTYPQGEWVTVRATPDVGCSFIKWMENGAEVSQDASYSFTVTEDRNLIAMFDAPFYDVSIKIDPSGSGTVSASGTYQHGSEVTVEAIPEAGYQFIRWMENDAEISTSPSYSFIIKGNRSLTAVFGVVSYDITVEPAPANTGSVSGAGTYEHGKQVTITAQPEEGYRFVKWTENGAEVSRDNPYIFEANSNRNLVAVFEALPKYNVAVSVDPSGAGAVTGGGTYQYGEQVTVRASSMGDMYIFVGWTEDSNEVSKNNRYTFTVDRDRDLVAVFEVITYTVTTNINPPNSGTVSGEGTYQHGTHVTVTAEPKEGYGFVRWTENDMEVSQSASYTFLITENRNLTAVFETLPKYTVSLSTDPSGAGVVYGDGVYTQGEQVMVSASLPAGQSFVGWRENGSIVSEDADYIFIITSDRNLTAVYEVADYNVTVGANPSGVGVLSGSGAYKHGSQVTVTAEDTKGYLFQAWTENGTTISEDRSYTFTITSNRNLIAVFRTISWEVALSADPSSGGSVSGGGIYQHLYEATIVATPEAGYQFVEWREDGNAVSQDASYTFTVNRDRRLVAIFRSNMHNLSLSVDPSGSGTISINGTQVTCNVTVEVDPSGSGTATGGGTYQAGSQVTVIATAGDSYDFAGWRVDGNVVSGDESYAFTVAGDITLTARFEAVKSLVYHGTATALSEARYGLAAATVGNYALFGGGFSEKSGNSIYHSIVDAYNSSLTRITATALSEARDGLVAATVGNHALFGGGSAYDNGTYNSSVVDAYNSSMTRTIPTKLSAERDCFAATTIGNYALFGGGYFSPKNQSGSYRSAVVDAYDSSLTRTTPTALGVERSHLAATTVGSYALFGGGYTTSDPSYSAIIDAYDSSLTRTTPTELSVARGNLAAAMIGDYALFGGGADDGKSSVVDAYDSSLTRTTPTALSVARGRLAATTVGNYALFGGGEDEGDYPYDYSAVVDAYDSSLTRTTPTTLSAGRNLLAATMIGNYALFGGGHGNNYSYHSTMDVYTLK